MKKLIIFLLILLLSMVTVPVVGSAYAEEITITNEENVLEASNWQEFFNKELWDKISVFLLSATGAVGGIIMVAIKLKRTIGSVNVACKELSLKKADIETATNQIIGKKDELIKISHEVKALTENIQNMQKQYKDIKKILEIGFCNNTELVANGYAREIAKVVENEKTEI